MVLPVRLESRRLPGKPFLDIGGRPLLWHSWHNVADSAVAEVIVATDSRSVAAAVRSWGGKAVVTEGRHRSGTDRIGEIADGLLGDRVINLQADELTFTGEDLARFLAEWEGSSAELLTPVYRIADAAELQDENTVKVAIGEGGETRGFFRDPGAARAAGAENSGWGHVGVYGYTKNMLELYRSLPPSVNEIATDLEQLRFLDNGHPFATYDIGHPRCAINTPADLARARALMATAPQ